MAWLLSGQWILKIHLTTLKQFLSFTLHLYGPSGAGSISFSSHLVPVRGDKVQAKNEGKAVIWSPLYTGKDHTSPLFWNAYNTPPKFQSTVGPHCVQKQTTNVKVPWNSHKPHFGKKFCLYPLNSTSTNWSKLVNVSKPHLMSIKSGACLYTPNRTTCTH